MCVCTDACERFVLGGMCVDACEEFAYICTCFSRPDDNFEYNSSGPIYTAVSETGSVIALKN